MGSPNSKTSVTSLVKSFCLALVLYATETLYNADMWMVIYDGGIGGDSISRLKAVFDCLLIAPIFTLTFKLVAFTYIAHQLRYKKLSWQAKLTAILAAWGTFLGRTYEYQYTMFGANLDGWVIGIAVSVGLGLYMMMRYLLIFFRQMAKWFFAFSIDPSSSLSWYFRKWEESPFFYGWLLIFASWLPSAILKYPIGTDWDGYFQMEEYFGIIPLCHRFWPVASTLFLGSMVDLGQALLGSLNNGAFFMILVQMLICSSILAYTLQAARELKIPTRWRCLMLAVYMLSPLYFSFCTSLLKDNLYACFIVLFTTLMAQAVLSGQASRTNYIFLSLTAFLVCIFRSNGVFVIIFCLLALAIPAFRPTAEYKKLGLALLAAFLASAVYNMGIVKIVNPPPGVVREALSIPFQQTAKVIEDYPQDIDPSERAIINSVFDYSLPNGYNRFCSDNVKATYRNDDSQLPAYFAVWFKQFFRHPQTYFEAAQLNNGGFFNVDMEAIWLYIHPRNHDKLFYEVPHWLELPKGYAYTLTECWWRMPLINLVSNTAVAIFAIIYLSILYISQRKYNLFYLLIPSIVGILVCLVSPTFACTCGIRYAFPITYAAPLIVGLSLTDKASSAERRIAL